MAYVQKGTPRKLTDLSKCPMASTNPSTFVAMLDWYICPTDQFYHVTSQTEPRTIGGINYTGIQYVLSYGFNTDNCYIRNAAGSAAQYSHKLNGIKRQADAVIFDEWGNDDSNGANTWVLKDHNDTDNQIEAEVRHLGGQDIVYADGHVQFHKLLANDFDGLGRNQRGLPHLPDAVDL